MSLINDALKRAKETQQQVPLPPPDLPLRPVEPGQQRARHSLGLLLPVALAVVALLGLAFVWQWAQSIQASKPNEVAARTAPAPGVTTAAPAVPTAINAELPAPAAALPPDEAPEPVSPVTPASIVVEPANSVVADAPVIEPTNATPVVVPTPPKPAPLRLQGILFNPKRPSAMISGKTVFVGDRIRDLRVMAIDKESVSLSGAGTTTVLSLID
ncbi:MAG TPA: hypothetical protein P5205_07255 [Candidatus Paceibacterota bacterium]|nr:hypothetical protein [Verrucomicrobiota bacterium]HSA10155.1 hypothetical protein [Candidatus Paceibacterota bacterium]